MSVGRGQFLHLRLFIENVEVPIIGAMLSASENAPASAQIEVIPMDRALELRPRSKVHVFYLDYDGLFTSDDTETVKQQQLRADNSRGILSSHYNLLFSGELFTMMYTKTGAGSRSLVLQCLDDSNNWDTAFLYMLKYSADGEQSELAGSQRAFLGLNPDAAQFDDLGAGQVEVRISEIASRQRARSKSLRKASGIIAGLFGVLELLGGVEGKYIGVSAWHTVQEARLRLMDQIAGDSGKTSQELFDASSFESWLTDRIGGGGSVISFRELIALINSYIYYDVYPNPVARYKVGRRTLPNWPETLGGSFNRLNPEFALRIAAVQAEMRGAGWNGEKGQLPEIQMTSSFRNMEDQNRIEGYYGRKRSTKRPQSAHAWGFAADFAIVGEGGTRGVEGMAGRGIAESVEEARGFHQKLITALHGEEITTLSRLNEVKGFPLTKVQFADILQVAKFFRRLGQAAHNQGLDWGGNWGRGDGGRKDELWDLFGIGWDPVHLQLKEWKKVVGTDVLATGAASSEAEEAFYAEVPDRDRLYTQFFRPNVWFVAPPACNIIFPEEMTSFTYTRQMMRETTRLQLTTFNAMYEDVLLNQVYFAPKFEEVESLAAGGIGSAAKAIIYPHERYSGVIPKMERLSEVALYSRLSDEQKIGKVEGLPEEEVREEEADTQLNLWAGRTAAFNFLSYRYAARTMAVSTRFLPRLVPGWPALIIDRVSSNVESTNTVNPTHFLGMVRTLSHSVTQAGGTTSVTLSHARSHKTGDDTDDLFAESLFADRGVLSIQAGDTQDQNVEVLVSSEMTSAHFQFALRLSQHLHVGGLIDPAPIVWLTEIPAEIVPGVVTAVFGKKTIPALGPRGGELISIKVERPDPSFPSDSLITFFNKGVAPEGGVVSQEVLEEADAVHIATGGAVVGTNASTGRQQVFSFTKAIVVEKSAKKGLLPLEEAVRPPWFSDEYSNENIGALYEDLLGCGSIMDTYTVAAETGYAGPSIAGAVEAVVENYSAVSGGGQQGSQFIQSVTERAHASLDQVIGTAAAPGFHYFSSGPLSNLEGTFYEWMRKKEPAKGEEEAGRLVTTQLDTSAEQGIDPKIDPREGRYRRALAYQSELLRFHGLRG